jgi:CubicO group peptidase (beta-lactamase class C family)
MLLLAQTSAYQAPKFTDNNRAEKLAKYFPLVEKIYRDYATKNHFPGYAFGIVLDGQLVFTGAGGFTDIAKKTVATTQSMFRIASMSKSFTAMAILKLRDDGKLKLDDPVTQYIPEMKGQQLTKDAPVMTIEIYCLILQDFPKTILGATDNWLFQMPI